MNTISAAVTLVIATAVIGACLTLARRLNPMRPIVNAWMQRESYKRIVRDVAYEYASARGLHYTSRDARAHIRAYIAVTYPGLIKEERNMVMRAAIEYGTQSSTATPLKDINQNSRAA